MSTKKACLLKCVFISRPFFNEKLTHWSLKYQYFVKAPYFPKYFWNYELLQIYFCSYRILGTVYSCISYALKRQRWLFLSKSIDVAIFSQILGPWTFHVILLSFSLNYVWWNFMMSFLISLFKCTFFKNCILYLKCQTHLLIALAFKNIFWIL